MYENYERTLFHWKYRRRAWTNIIPKSKVINWRNNWKEWKFCKNWKRDLIKKEKEFQYLLKAWLNDLQYYGSIIFWWVDNQVQKFFWLAFRVNCIKWFFIRFLFYYCEIVIYVTFLVSFWTLWYFWYFNWEKLGFRG